jgi:hypothetical protein
MKREITLFVVFALLVVAVIFGTIFSVVTTSTTNNFRQEVMCGTTSIYEYNNWKIEYRTEAKQGNLIDPRDSYQTTCIPVEVKLYDDEILVYQTNGINNFDGEVTMRTSRTVDGQEYTIPNGWFDRVEVSIQDSFHTFIIRNRGWDSSGRTTGSIMTWVTKLTNDHIEARILSTPQEIITLSKVGYEIQPNIPDKMSYQDICIIYRVKGVIGDVEQESCKGESGILQGDKITGEFVLENNELSEFEVEIVVKDLELFLETYTTTGVRASDLDKIINNKIKLGSVKTDFIQVQEEIIPIEPIEPIVEEPVEQDNEITGGVIGLVTKPLSLVLFGFVIIGVIGLFIFRGKLKGGRK